jgi:AraC-like DNA-binding protein
MQTILDRQEPEGTDFSQTSKSRNPFAELGKIRADERALIEALLNSEVYQAYEKAFSDTTGMPVALRPLESWHFSHHDKRADGTCNAAVPVRLGDRIIGFLQQTRELDTEGSELPKTNCDAKVMSVEQRETAIKKLNIFAQYISLLSNQVLVQQKNSESPVITRAREYIHEHYTEELSLGRVAKAVNTSTFYFCKMFKKVTGVNFTDYISQMRIEKSKSLLIDPDLRVSEIAFEVGFQSLTHFNRVFKKIVGQSPSQYRAQLRDD